jgi:hypothetical protein
LEFDTAPKTPFCFFTISTAAKWFAGSVAAQQSYIFVASDRGMMTIKIRQVTRRVRLDVTIYQQQN